jgi:hypothetical protein
MRACDGTEYRSRASDQPPRHFHDLWLRRAGEFKPVLPAAVPDAPDIEIEFGLAA